MTKNPLIDQQIIKGHDGSTRSSIIRPLGFPGLNRFREYLIIIIAAIAGNTKPQGSFLKIRIDLGKTKPSVRGLSKGWKYG